MPDLTKINDSKELLNRYKAKTILYVEGPSDRTAYRRLVGDRFLIDFDFEIPPGGTGANAVRKRVREERANNENVFGFLDGEAAAALGAVKSLVECDDLLFSVHCADFAGLIFIAAHELENLILGYCDVAPTIANHKPLTRLNDNDADAVRQRLSDLTGRFLASAMFKYASLHLQSKGDCVSVASTHVFTQAPGLRQTLEKMREVVEKQLKLDWSIFVAELFEITRAMRDRINAKPKPVLSKTLRYIRLADGKKLMAQVRGNVGKDVEGHLLGVLAKSPFVEELRTAIRSEVALAA